MDRESALSLLRAGNITPELSAWVCVELQYVPGVPEARAITSQLCVDVPGLLYTDGKGIVRLCAAPDLSSLDAIAALWEARGQGDRYSFEFDGRTHYVSLFNEKPTRHSDFEAPTLASAWLGAIVSRGRE
jgi:hypothetical protein